VPNPPHTGDGRRAPDANYVAVLLLAVIYLRLWQAARRLSGWPRGLALGLAGAWTQINVHNLVDNVYVNNVHLYVGVLLALTAWLTYLTLDRTRAGAAS